MTRAALDTIEARGGKMQRRSAVLATAAGLVWIAQAASIAAALDGYLDGNPTGSLLPYLAGFLLASALRIALEHHAAKAASASADVVVASLRAELSERIARRAPRALETSASGAVAILAADKLEALRGHLIRWPAARLRATVIPLALAASVATVTWAGAVILLVAGPLIPLFMALVGMAAKAASARQSEAAGTTNALLLDRVRGLIDIRLLDATEHVAEDFRRASDDLRERTMAVLRVAFLSSTVLELFSALGVALMAVYVGFSLLDVLNFGAWGGDLSLGAGLFALMLAPEFFQPLRDFSAAWHDRAAAQAVAEELRAESESDAPSILGAGASARSERSAPPLILKGVRASAHAAPVSATIAPGERVAITGPSGVGKTALLHALAGFEQPDDGAIFLGARPLDKTTADTLRANIAWIGQAPQFLSASIRANVALYGDIAETERLGAALETAAAQGFIATLPQGIATPLGEAGQGVSGGEARRLAIAQAAFAERPVILADEPTADLDDETAEDVMAGLERLAADGRTLIVATHDPKLIARMDREITLEPL